MGIYKEQLKIKKLFLLLLVCTVAGNLNGQNVIKPNDPANRKIGVGLQFLGPTLFLSAQGDYYIGEYLLLSIQTLRALGRRPGRPSL